jgi:hypothetical protein
MKTVQSVQYYEQIAAPFEWKFTDYDLHAVLERIARHDDADRTVAARPARRIRHRNSVPDHLACEKALPANNVFGQSDIRSAKMPGELSGLQVVERVW